MIRAAGLMLSLLSATAATAPTAGGQVGTRPAGGGCRILAPSQEARERAREVLQPVMRRFALHFGEVPGITIRLVPSVRESGLDEEGVLCWFDREAFLRDPERHAAGAPELGGIVTSAESPGTVRVAALMPAVGGAPTSPLQRGDLILTMDGAPVHDARTLAQRVHRAAPGEEMTFGVQRDGERLQLRWVRGPDVDGRTEVGLDAERMRAWIFATTPSLPHAAAHRLLQLWWQERAEAGRPDAPPWLAEAVALLAGGLGERITRWKALVEAEELPLSFDAVLARKEPVHGERAEPFEAAFQTASMALLRVLLLRSGESRAGPLVEQVLAGDGRPGRPADLVADLDSLLPLLGTWEEEGPGDRVILRVFPDRVRMVFMEHDQVLPVSGLDDAGLHSAGMRLSLAEGDGRLQADLVGLGSRVLRPAKTTLALRIEPSPFPDARPVSPQDRRVLRERLAALAEQDQAVRDKLVTTKPSGGQTAYLETLCSLWQADRELSRALREILSTRGWLSGEVLGRKALHDVWLLAHHSGDLRLKLAVLPHLRQEQRAGHLDPGTLRLFTGRLIRRLGGPLLALDAGVGLEP